MGMPPTKPYNPKMHSHRIIYTFLLLMLVGLWYQLTQPIFPRDNTIVASAERPAS